MMQWKPAKTTKDFSPIEIVDKLFFFPHFSVNKSQQNLLGQCGITHLLNVGEAVVFPDFPGIQFRSIQISSEDPEEMFARLKEALELVQMVLDQNGKIGVVDISGSHSSFVVLLSFTMRTKGLSFPEAFKHLSGKVPECEQYDKLVTYEPVLALFSTERDSLDMEEKIMPNYLSGERKFHVVIIGGGFAGCNLAIRLQKKPDRFNITLIDPKGYFEYTPALNKIVVDEEETNIFIPLEDIVKYGDLIVASVTGVDQDTVQLSSGKSLKYDYLCVCTGMSNDWSLVEQSFQESSLQTKDVLSIYEKVKSSMRDYKHFKDFCKRSYCGETVDYLDLVDHYFDTYKRLMVCEQNMLKEQEEVVKSPRSKAHRQVKSESNSKELNEDEVVSKPDRSRSKQTKHKIHDKKQVSSADGLQESPSQAEGKHKQNDAHQRSTTPTVSKLPLLSSQPIISNPISISPPISPISSPPFFPHVRKEPTIGSRRTTEKEVPLADEEIFVLDISDENKNEKNSNVDIAIDNEVFGRVEEVHKVPSDNFVLVSDFESSDDKSDGMSRSPEQRKLLSSRRIDKTREGIMRALTLEERHSPTPKSKIEDAQEKRSRRDAISPKKKHNDLTHSQNVRRGDSADRRMEGKKEERSPMKRDTVDVVETKKEFTSPRRMRRSKLLERKSQKENENEEFIVSPGRRKRYSKSDSSDKKNRSHISSSAPNDSVFHRVERNVSPLDFTSSIVFEDQVGEIDSGSRGLEDKQTKIHSKSDGTSARSKIHHEDDSLRTRGKSSDSPHKDSKRISTSRNIDPTMSNTPKSTKRRSEKTPRNSISQNSREKDKITSTETLHPLVTSKTLAIPSSQEIPLFLSAPHLSHRPKNTDAGNRRRAVATPSRDARKNYLSHEKEQLHKELQSILDKALEEYLNGTINLYQDLTEELVAEIKNNKRTEWTGVNRKLMESRNDVLQSLNDRLADFTMPVVPVHNFFGDIDDRTQWLRLERKAMMQSKQIGIIGGGPSAVELASMIISKWPSKEITLLTSGNSILPRAAPSIQKSLQKQLSMSGVNIKTREKVISVRTIKKRASVLTETDSVFSFDRVYFCSCYKGNISFLKTHYSSAIQENQLVRVNKFLQLEENPNIFVLGDACDLEEEKTAERAVAHSLFVSNNINRLSKGEKMMKYSPLKKPLVTHLGVAQGISFISNGWIVGRGWFTTNARITLQLETLDSLLKAFGPNNQSGNNSSRSRKKKRQKSVDLENPQDSSTPTRSNSEQALANMITTPQSQPQSHNNSPSIDTPPQKHLTKTTSTKAINSKTISKYPPLTNRSTTARMLNLVKANTPSPLPSPVPPKTVPTSKVPHFGLSLDSPFAAFKQNTFHT